MFKICVISWLGERMRVDYEKHSQWDTDPAHTAYSLQKLSGVLAIGGDWQRSGTSQTISKTIQQDIDTLKPLEKVSN